MNEHDNHTSNTTGDLGDPKDVALEAALRDALATRGNNASADPAAWRRIDARRQSHSNRNHTVFATAGFLAAAAAVALVFVIARGDREAGITTINAPETQNSTTTGPTAEVITGPRDTTPSTTTPLSVGAIRDIDFANFTYPGDACAEPFRPLDSSIKLVNGEGLYPVINQPADYEALALANVRAVEYGDVTGDGREDAVVVLRCGSNGTEYLTDGVLVFSSRNDTRVPELIGTRFEAGLPTSYGTLTRVTDDVSRPVTERVELEELSVDSVGTNDGLAVVAWYRGTYGQPDVEGRRRITVSYRVVDGRLEQVGAPVEQIDAPVSDPCEPGCRIPPAQMYAIRYANIRSVALPLADNGRIPTDRACHYHVFKDLDVRDAELVDGHADVVDVSGAPLDASVDLDEVRFTDMTGDQIEEAIAVLRCRQGIRSVRTAIVFALVDGHLEFRGALNLAPGSPPFESIAEVRTVPQGVQPASFYPSVEIVWERESDGTTPGRTQMTVTYFWRDEMGNRLSGRTYEQRSAP